MFVFPFFFSSGSQYYHNQMGIGFPRRMRGTLQPSAPRYPQHDKYRRFCFTTAPANRSYGGGKGRGAGSFCSLKFKQLDSARVPRVFPRKEVSGSCRQIAWEQASGVPLEAPPPQLCLEWSTLARIRLWLSQRKTTINSRVIVTCLALCKIGHLPKSDSSCLRLPALPSPLQLQKGSVSHVSAHGCTSPGHEVQFLQVLCPWTVQSVESLLPEAIHLLCKVLREGGCGSYVCVPFFSSSWAKSFFSLKELVLHLLSFFN